jgi:hypothetical protein
MVTCLVQWQVRYGNAWHGGRFGMVAGLGSFQVRYGGRFGIVVGVWRDLVW